MAGPVDVEELAAGLVDALEGMGAEVVALGLEQIRGEAFATVGIVIAESPQDGVRPNGEFPAAIRHSLYCAM